MDKVIIIARNWSIVLLALQFLVLGAVPLFVLIKITQALRSLLPNVRPGLQTANMHVGTWAGKVQGVLSTVDRVLDHSGADDTVDRAQI